MTSAWVPMIAALAALLGVIVGQFWQGRREDKRWSLERERDAEHREDQRQRDHALWAREDRNRFTEQKRQMYVDYQTCAYRISVFLVDIGHSLHAAESAREEDFNRSAFLDQSNFAEQFTDIYNDLKVIRNHIRLLAPPNVLTAVTRIDEALIPAIQEVSIGGVQAVRKVWRNLRIARFDLLDAMRRDLNPEAAALADGSVSQLISIDDAEKWPA